jgi:copper(I)-binding protein
MKSKLNRLVLSGLFLLLTAFGVQAEAQVDKVPVDKVQVDNAQVNKVQVNNAWMRLLPPTSKMTAAYMSLKSDLDDRLVGVSSEVANVVEIHQSKMEDGVMSMQEVSCLELPAGQIVELKPQSYHLMVMGLKTALKAGDVHRFVLEFEQAGSLEIAVPVRD